MTKGIYRLKEEINMIENILNNGHFTISDKVEMTTAVLDEMTRNINYLKESIHKIDASNKVYCEKYNING